LRDAFAEELYAAAREDDRIVLVAADISPASAMARFVEEFPGRFVNVGIAEQAMIGMCAGLALRGFRPFAYTIATFAAFRPFEQIRDDLGYQELPVTVVGVGGGVNYSALGGTHHAMEDVAVMSAIPGMTVLAPCDPAETRETVKAVLTRTGPSYLRLGKAGEPDLTSAAEPFSLGAIRRLRDGSDGAIVGYGPILRLATGVADALGSEGVSLAVYSAPTVKPFDEEGISRLLHSYSSVFIVEEHVPHGGLASRVRECAWTAGARCTIDVLTLQDRFVHVYGSHDVLLEAHGLSAATLERTVRRRFERAT
jgi:transketolase